MNPPTLNRQQQQAVDSILQFTKSESDCFILRGSAGTGKTTLIGHLVQQLSAVGQRCQLVTPTGRAARILNSKTGVDARTIHSVIYSLSKIDVNEEARSENDPGIRLFFPLRTDDPGDLLFIVDEASIVGDIESKQEMLQFGSGKLLSDLVHYARLGRTGHAHGCGSRILFVGDPAQLPPVGEQQSPALSADYLSDNFGLNAKESELTEVMRQVEGGEILECATKLRDSIVEKRFNVLSIKGNGTEIKAVSNMDAVNLVADGFRKGGTGTGSALVTYSNAQALELNRAVRMRRYGQEKLPLQVGDILLVNKNSLKSNLSNGDLIKVLNTTASPEIRDVWIKGISDPIRLLFRHATIGFRALNGDIINNRCILLDNLLDSRERELSPLEQRALLVEFRQRHPEVRPGTAEFKLTIRDDSYFNALQVKYGYALTCHKAQGGEWDTVAVDFSGARGHRNEAFFRWSYTAMTRAKSNLLTIDAPDFDALSEQVWGKPSPVDDTSRYPIDDPDWNRFSFLSGQERLFDYFQKIRDSLLKSGVQINDVSHLQYCERYTLSRNDLHTIVQYWYKRNSAVSRVERMQHVGEDVTFGEELSKLFEKALLTDSSDEEGSEPDFIREFRDKVEQVIEKTDIRLVSTQSMPYRFRMEFESDGYRAKIDFNYDGKSKWTKVEEVGGSGASNGLKERLQQLLQE